jgi:hypothetical protein
MYEQAADCRGNFGIGYAEAGSVRIRRRDNWYLSRILWELDDGGPVSVGFATDEIGREKLRCCAAKS